jgi:hypothetical protein
MIRITFLNSNNKIDQRFSGIDWFPKLLDTGWGSKMLVGFRPASSILRVKQMTLINSQGEVSTFQSFYAISSKPRHKDYKIVTLVFGEK